MLTKTHAPNFSLYNHNHIISKPANYLRWQNYYKTMALQAIRLKEFNAKKLSYKFF